MPVFPELLVLHSIAIDKYEGLAMKATVVYVMLYYSEENIFVCLPRHRHSYKNNK